MCILQMTNEKVLTELDPVRVFAGVDPVTGEPIAEDWASPGAQFRAGFEGHLRKIPLGDDDAELSEVCHQSHPAPPQLDLLQSHPCQLSPQLAGPCPGTDTFCAR